MVQRAQRVKSASTDPVNRSLRQRNKPFGNATRGTTNPNRLRRVDRWLAGPQVWRLRRDSMPGRPPVVVDLGYGGSPTTAVELYARIHAVCPEAHVSGIEIEPARVLIAKPLEHEGLDFRVGGFEIPVAGQVTMIRAFNVLRQYDEADVRLIWATVCSRLSPHGIFVDGTCDEIGRRSTWIALDPSGPVSLTISMRFGSFELPSNVAERLPKALIHHNVPGEKINDFLAALDKHWLSGASLAAFGNRQRWLRMCQLMYDDGWPVVRSRSRWRLGELSVAWSGVDPGPKT
ncbi:class I SAM-dependent methyltransferase [Arthrobacter cryoconiti]|uniref:Class I SAM-dependent methyltransferase n=1 Tax=Arthrobacter cryoconiti TaxID=748907 RepID=A0ABV8QZF4_9MICC|nr:class I SAM-dependent methyltransferase [Arthrobacter cryoconiti]MCC9067733.1 class I SAM-dependent methyltransferase [Arthrobacter cryoconiti]